MNEPSARSPFAARSSQEQQEQWLCWQSQRPARQPLSKPTGTDSRSESVLDASKPTESRFHLQPGSSQYAAVVQRMRRAVSKAQGYASWAPADSTVQPSSGS